MPVPTQVIPRLKLSILVVCLLFSGCSGLLPTNLRRVEEQRFEYRPDIGQEKSLLFRFAPGFMVADAAEAFNRIGSPVVIPRRGDTPVIAIDTEQPAIFAEERSVITTKGTYRSLIYRVNFPGVPFSLAPFHLTAGSSAGLLVIITMDAQERPLLFSVVHTCGCFLAMIPTSRLDPAAFPPRWNRAGQSVFGAARPGLLDYGQGEHPEDRRIVIAVRSGMHRVVDVRLETARSTEGEGRKGIRRMPIRPMTDLEHLPYAGVEISLFETHGPRRGYVRNSIKPLEAMLMGW